MYQSNCESTAHPHYSVLLPSSILSASRCEFSDLTLQIEGNLPKDLQGHFFMVAPVGSVNSGGLPYPSGNSLLNGDGMIYRLDFNPPGQVQVTTKLVTPPDYYADLATRPGSEYAKFGFHNRGITRFSKTLGLRNQLNTAFLPMPFSPDAPQRLLVTYDAGRPYEIDPNTLETVTPVGANAEWEPEIEGIHYPFQPFLSTAHPVFDAHTGKMFTVNYGRSVRNFLYSIPLINEVQELPQEVEEWVDAIAGFVNGELTRDLLHRFSHLFRQVTDEISQIIEDISGIELDNFVYLLRWDGQGNLERWKVVLPDGSPIKIKQTIHQIGMSQDYIVLMDTAFVTGIEQVLNNPLPNHKNLEAILREISGRAANPDSVIYVIRRRDLEQGQLPALEGTEVEVTAQQLTIPMEAAHFLMDYDNPNGHITLHFSHICAWDVAEWIHKFDRSAYGTHPFLPEQVQGMETNPMDISRFGRYVIDAEQAELLQSQIIYETPYTWGTGLYAYLDRLPSGLPPSRLDHIYWSSLGLWPELMTKYTVQLYEDYKYRAIPLADLLDLAKERIPSCLLHVDTTAMKIVDVYQAPVGTILNSPQFIPRQGAEGNLTDGYLMCTAFFENRNELWLFDAQNLSQGPICQLSHPDLNFGFTLHTTWLPTIGPREANYKIPVATDYNPLVSQHSNPQIQELFDQHVYPHFP